MAEHDNRDPKAPPGQIHRDAQHAGLAMVGMQVAVGVGVGYAVGWWLDQRYGWSPWGVIVGSMIGLAGGLYLLIKDAIRINKD